MYGFFTSYSSAIVTVSRLQYILTNALAVLGFGLLLVYFKYTIKQTLIIALVVCSVNVQLGPLIQQFWYNVFINGFYASYGVPTASETPYLMIRDTPTQNINSITLGFVRISTYTSISLLVGLSSVIGKIGLFSTFIASILFNIGWNLSYYLNYMIYFQQTANSYTFQIMDDFQGSRVFMFGAGFGLALLLIYNKYAPARVPAAQYSDTFSSLFTLLGTAFVISLFYFVLDTYTQQSRLQSLLNIFFAFSGSIVSSIAISCILDGVITLHNVNMSVIAGALQISIIGGFIKTPYVSILVGAFAGIVTALASSFIHSKLNHTKIRDSKGVFVIYFINCLLCSYFICPIIIKAYKNVGILADYNDGFHMVYTSISLGIGFLTGLLAGIFRCCFN